MSVEIGFLQPRQEQEYEEVLKTDEQSLLCSSIKYRNLLKHVVDGEDYYLVGMRNGEIIAMLPTFLKYNPKYGNCFNSLPFYGSNGGVTCRHSVSDAKAVKTELLAAFRSLAAEKKAISSTIITSPFEQDIDIYDNFGGWDYRDSRIGQISTLPVADEDLDSALMTMLHSKTRNLVRKAYKEKVRHRDSDSMDDLQFLAETHKQNIEAIGGLPKSWDFFNSIPKIFAYDRDYRVYVAELDSKRIAALLVFYYNKTVEYFTPTIVTEYRNLQPNSMLIFEAMKNAARRGYRYWNWGGTWLAQKEVYHFKERWGTNDFSYYYYIKTCPDISAVRSLTKSMILQEYPYFYVLPFSELKNPVEG